MFLDKEDKITGDWELQAWGAELVKAREEGGCGLLVGVVWVARKVIEQDCKTHSFLENCKRS